MARVTYFMSMGGSEILTTMDCVGDLGPTTFEALNLGNFWGDGLAKFCSNQLSLTGLRVDDRTYQLARAATVNSDPENASTAMIINKRNIGKPGRFFMPGITAINIDASGQVANSYRTLVTDAMNAAYVTLQAAGIDIVVSNGTVERVVTGFDVSRVVGIQGRRRFGR